jgi:pimeloyl-ACP methyl ester carboxylesterase
MRSAETSQAAVAPATVPPVGPVLADGESSRTVRLSGVTLAVRSRRSPGGLEPALHVHGLGGSSQNWSPLMAELAGVVDSQAPDLPGFGHSPPPDDGNYSLAGHARAVVRLLESERRGPVHLFGNSMGGAVAVKVAAARPDLVRTLTLVSPALPEVPPQRTAWPTALASVPGLPRLYMRATRDWPAERRAAAMFELCYGDPARVAARTRADAAAEYQRRLELPYFWDALIRSTRGIVNAYTLGGRHSLWRQAERVMAPTLLVYGGRDKLVSVRRARRAARAFHRSRLLVIPSGGHVAMMEYPELVARAFRDLLDEVRGPGAAARLSPGGGPTGAGDTGDTGDTGTDTGPTTAAATGS